MATAGLRALPDFVVIGGQRCGTTSLWSALSNHPSIEPAVRKEVHFFDLHFNRGPGWYRANFPLRRSLGSTITGEATPNYLAHPACPERVATQLPTARFVVLLRDPVERAYSSWKLRTAEGAEDRSFAEAIEDGMAGRIRSGIDSSDASRRSIGYAARFAYLDKSRYSKHLTQWFELIERDRFLIVQSEELFANPSTELARIQEFIGVPVDHSVQLEHSNGVPRQAMETEIRTTLTGYFSPLNSDLERITDRTFSWA